MARQAKLPSQIVKLRLGDRFDQVKDLAEPLEKKILAPRNSKSKVVKRTPAKRNSRTKRKHGETVLVDGKRIFVKGEKDDDYDPEEDLDAVGSRTTAVATREVTTRSQSRAQDASGSNLQIVPNITKGTRERLFSTPIWERSDNGPVKSCTILPMLKTKFYWDMSPYHEHKVTKKRFYDIARALVPEMKIYEPAATIRSKDSSACRADNKGPVGPVHGDREFSVHSLCKILMSQATENGNALQANQKMCKYYPYFVNGEEIRTQTPNYHTIRTGPIRRLQEAMRPAGRQVGTATRLKGILNKIFEENQKRSTTPLSEENEQGARDFVPGALSMDYLLEKPAREIYDELIKFDGIGPKSAHCALLFSLDYPVFATDTHVVWMAWYLDLIPDEVDRSSDRNFAAMHLDLHCPHGLKYFLHQAFWHHRNNCVKCEGLAVEGSKKWNSAAECSLASFIVRRETAEGKNAAKRARAEDRAAKSVPGQGTAKSQGKPWHIALDKMTPEEAEAKEYEMRVVNKDSDFGASRHFTTEKVWEYVGDDPIMEEDAHDSENKPDDLNTDFNRANGKAT